MPGVGDLVANLTLNSAGFSKGLSDAKGTLGSFAGGIAKSLGPIAGALAAAWGGAASVSGYKEALSGQRKLASVLQATGGAAGVTAEQINDYSSDLQAMTNFEGDATVGAAAMMTRFENIKGEMFFSTLDAAADLASVMGTDLVSATNLLGKAMDDPTAGLGKLAKAGVNFTEAQENQIKALQASGDMIGAQGVIMDNVAGKFGGSAKAMADPWTIAQNSIGDVGEMIGSLLLPVIDVASKAITWASGKVLEYGETFKAIGIEAAVWMEAIGGAIIQYAIGAWEMWSPVVAKIAEVFTWAWGIISDGFGTAMEVGIEALLIFQNWPAIIEIAAKQGGLYIVEFANDVMFMFTDQLPAVISWFADNWQDILFTAVDYTLTIFINLGQNIRNMWSAVLNFFKGNGFEYDWTPLTEGAASAISKLPDIPERVATKFETSMKADIAGLTENLGASMDAQRKELTAGLNKSREAMTAAYSPELAIPTPPETPDDPAAGGAGGKGKQSAAAQMAGSTEAYSTIAAAFMNKGKDPTVAAIDKQTDKLIASNEKTRAPEINVIESLPE